MDFQYALTALKEGQRVARSGWNGKDMTLGIKFPDVEGYMTLPYIYIEYPVGHVAYPSGMRVPWVASQTDLFSDDWFMIY